MLFSELYCHVSSARLPFLLFFSVREFVRNFLTFGILYFNSCTFLHLENILSYFLDPFFVMIFKLFLLFLSEILHPLFIIYLYSKTAFPFFLETISLNLPFCLDKSCTQEPGDGVHFKPGAVFNNKLLFFCKL